MVPSVAPGDRWYVYYRFRNPVTGKMDLPQLKLYRDINRLKTVAERKRYGHALAASLLMALQEGFNPYDKQGHRSKPYERTYTVKQAFTAALEDKNALKSSTYSSYWDYLNPFIAWLDKNRLADAPLEKLTKRHVIAYFSYLGAEKPEGKGLLPTSVDNTRRSLGAIMAKLKADDLVRDNFISDIVTNRSKPKKNAPFTKDELQLIKDYSQQHYPILYDFLRFIFYTFMRNTEIVRV